jgi:PAS domain-containing protein
MSTHGTDRDRMARLGSEELEWFVQSAPVALLVLDPAGAVTAANASASALIGESVQGVYGRGALGLAVPVAIHSLTGGGS